ncbi:MAG: hypothetical protein JSV92_01245 [archaeon]|nr:MAG: hypothetical protein JSV92_01245 [archaeon]
MNLRKIFDYYSQDGILERIVRSARDREVSFSKRDGSHLSRPNTLVYPRDVLEMVKKGAVSFHGSVERWRNPMQLGTRLSEKELNELRKGWDLIIDIDSSIGLEASKLAAVRVLSFLRKHGINKPGLKFSGNRGFHIGIPWEAFPRKVDYTATKDQFPHLPQVIATFIRAKIKDDLMQDLIKMKGSLRSLVEDLDRHLEELTPYIFVDIEKDWGSRHLFRMPYTVNEKTFSERKCLVTLPLKNPESFKRDDASIERIKPKLDFFRETERGEATSLVIDAMDWYSERKKEERKKPKGRIRRTRKVPEERFPPCIKLILRGLSDGRKRSVFILANFLASSGWRREDAEKRILEWNRKNSPPLKDNYIKTQLKWFERQRRNLLPPNCDNQQFYKSFGVCKPDSKCKKIKNPVVYPFKK